MELSIFFFAASARAQATDRYRLPLEAARFADEHGFSAVWTPERHFGDFGGLYPSASVMGAALATATRRIGIRAGSVVLPLNHPVRVAEEWSMIDNLSGGRVALSFASGWHVNDFVLAPERYAGRREALLEQIDTVRRLWRGESVELPNGAGAPTRVSIVPPPVQGELPVWLTAQSDETFALAAREGFNVLTNFNYKSPGDLARKLAVYHDGMRERHGRPGHATVMVHTFVGADAATARTIAEPALREYLRTNLDLQQQGMGGAGMTDDDREFLLQRATARFIGEASLIGGVEECRERLARLREMGIDELACLVDFGIGTEEVLESLGRLGAIRGTVD